MKRKGSICYKKKLEIHGPKPVSPLKRETITDTPVKKNGSTQNHYCLIQKKKAGEFT